MLGRKVEEGKGADGGDRDAVSAQVAREVTFE